MRIIAAALLLLSTPVFAASLTEAAAAKKAQAAITQGHWTSLALECISLEAGKPEWTFVVREEHNATCGGDTLTAPRLFNVRVDPWTGVATRED